MAIRLRFVDTAASAGGDGTTRNHSGATRAYASLETALSSEFSANSNLAGDILHIKCAGSVADTFTGGFDIPVFTNPSASDYLLIEPDDGADEGTYGPYDNDGRNPTRTWSTSHYRVVTGADGTWRTNYTKIRNLQIDTRTGSDRISPNFDFDFSEISGNIFRSGGNVIGLDFHPSISDIEVFNNLFLVNVAAFHKALLFRGGSDCAKFNNNTFIGDAVANAATIEFGSGTVVDEFKNNAFYNNTDDLLNSGATITVHGNNASDNSGTDTEIDVALGAPGDAFVDHTSGDYGVKDENSNLYDAGDSNYAPPTDLIGTARDGNTDIGAFELIVSGPPAVKPIIGRRRRQMLGVR